jgi:hypothetical protein
MGIQSVIGHLQMRFLQTLGEKDQQQLRNFGQGQVIYRGVLLKQHTIDYGVTLHEHYFTVIKIGCFVPILGRLCRENLHPHFEAEKCNILQNWQG